MGEIEVNGSVPRRALESAGESSMIYMIFWLLSGVARGQPYSQRAHADADREADGHCA
jgi:hypothetical protein